MRRPWDTLLTALDAVTLPPEQRLKETEWLMKVAAMIVRDTLSGIPEGTKRGYPAALEALSQTLRSIARAIWRQDVWLARRLAASTSPGSRFLITDPDSVSRPDRAALEVIVARSARWHEKQVRAAAWRVRNNDQRVSEGQLT